MTPENQQEQSNPSPVCGQTPRTDEYESTYAQARFHIQSSHTEWMTLVPADFARQLERELEATKKELELIRSEVPFKLRYYPPDDLRAKLAVAEEALKRISKSPLESPLETAVDSVRDAASALAAIRAK